MKSRMFTGVALLIAIALILFVLLHRKPIESAREPGPHLRSATQSPIAKLPSAQISAREASERPRLFKSTRYPPETIEERALWDWWRATEKSDPKFEWKMPIEFYGRVVDQFGGAVDAATVNLEWTVVGGTIKQSVKTAVDGSFSLQGVRGKLLGVNILKEGYLHTKESNKSFEYAAFFQENFHVPDPAHPIVFRLQKLLGSEPYYEFPLYGRFPANGDLVRLNIADGKFSDSGELAISVRLEGNTERGPAYTVRIEARAGVGIVATTEEFPFLAPDADYLERLVVRQDPAERNYERSTVLKLFLKLPGERYAYVGVTTQFGDAGREFALSGGVRYNDKWSRNLEFDHRKRLNR